MCQFHFIDPKVAQLAQQEAYGNAWNRTIQEWRDLGSTLVTCISERHHETTMWSHSAARRTRRLKLLKCINLASIIAMTTVRVLDFKESGDGRCAMCTTVRCPKARVAATPRFVALEAVPEGIVDMQICRWDVGCKMKDCISFHWTFVQIGRSSSIWELRFIQQTRRSCWMIKSMDFGCGDLHLVD